MYPPLGVGGEKRELTQFSEHSRTVEPAIWLLNAGEKFNWNQPDPLRWRLLSLFLYARGSWPP